MGDAVLELRVSEQILAAYPEADEGELTRLRGWMVSARNLAATAGHLELGRHLCLSHSEESVGGRHKQRLLANALEAVIAAVYHDGGYAAAAAVIDAHILAPSLARHHAGALHEFAFKSALQERAHAAGLPLPVYRLLEATGPEHAKRFTVEVRLADGTSGTGTGLSKKDAEQRAAAAALEQQS